MQSGQIRDNQITATPKIEGDEDKARLNNIGDDYWSTESSNRWQDLGYIQVDLLEAMFVTQVETQVKDGRMKFWVFHKTKKNDDFEAIRTENGNKHVRK